MAPEDAVAAKDWARVERLAREAVRFALGFEIRHVGINCEDPARAREAAERLSLLTGWPVQPESDRAVYVGEQLEVMKLMNRGNRGHLALACGSVERAIWHLSRRGFRFDMATLMTGEEGKPAFVYLEDEIAGFSFHLIRK